MEGRVLDLLNCLEGKGITLLELPDRLAKEELCQNALFPSQSGKSLRKRATSAFYLDDKTF
jgi:hypothetical protein